MKWDEFTEKYGEYPWEHYDDPADFWEAQGDYHRANAIRARRRAVEKGDKPEEVK